MEYTDTEKEIMALIDRTDFRNLSKNDFISYASKLNELRPEVAAQVIAQYPEYVNFVHSCLIEYKDILSTIIASDDSSLKQTLDLIHQEIEHSDQSRTEYIQFAEKVQADCSKCLDNPDMTPEQRQEIIDREIEIMKMVDQKDTEARKQEQSAVQEAEQKDSEKRMFNWKVIGGASVLVLTAVGIGTAMLGGKFNIKLPIKK